MINALWITLIGMGLVFAAILALWGLMALLVSAAAWFEKPAAQSEALVLSTEEPLPGGSTTDRERRVAAAAVAVDLALAMQRASLSEAQPGGSTLSAWQAVQRASQLNQSDTLSKKKVVR